MWAQNALGIPQGTIKATVLIETIPAAFEMDEILFELRNHAAGLNCGRWDYIFSFIKKFRNRPDFVLPDRSQVTMTTHFLRSYSRLLINTCHRRGAHAMGGMAAQIPIKNDPAANEQALAKVRADKAARSRRRSRRHVGGPSRTGRRRQGGLRLPHAHAEPAHADQSRLPGDGSRSVAGSPGDDHARGIADQRVGRRALSRSMAARQRLRAAVPSDGGRGHGRDIAGPNLAVDSPSARVLWRRHQDHGGTGRARAGAELDTLRAQLGGDAYAASRFDEAAELFRTVSTADEFVEFLTLPAYELLE